MGRQTRQDLRLIKRQLQDRERHRLLNGIMGAIGQQLQQQLERELPPPTGKQESTEELRLRLLLVEQLDLRQQQRVQQVLQRCSNPQELLRMLEAAGFFERGR